MWSGGALGADGALRAGGTSCFGLASCVCEEAFGSSRVGVSLAIFVCFGVVGGAGRCGLAGTVAAGVGGAVRRLATHAAMRRSVSGGSWKKESPKRLRPEDVVPWTRATNASGSTHLDVSSSAARGSRTRTNSLSLSSPLISTPRPPSLRSTTSAATSPTRVERTARTRCGTRADARRSELGWDRRAMDFSGSDVRPGSRHDHVALRPDSSHTTDAAVGEGSRLTDFSSRVRRTTPEGAVVAQPGQAWRSISPSAEASFGRSSGGLARH